VLEVFAMTLRGSRERHFSRKSDCLAVFNRDVLSGSRQLAGKMYVFRWHRIQRHATSQYGPSSVGVTARPVSLPIVRYFRFCDTSDSALDANGGASSTKASE
jgi:hypothetical protein